VLDDRVRTVLARLEAEDADERARNVPREQRGRQVARTSGQFLFAFVAPQTGCEVLEIGGSRGYSTIWLAAGARYLGGRVLSLESDPAKVEALAHELGIGNKVEDLFAAVGYGKVSMRQVLARLVPAEKLEEPPPPEKPSPLTDAVKRLLRVGEDRITVKGSGDLLIYRAKCCNPIMGEPIVGYITRGKGVSVHALSCPNVTNLMYDPERRIAVEWAREGKSKDGASAGFPVKLTVFCDDRSGMLKQIATIISDENTNIRNIEARTANRQANIDVVIDIEHLKHLEHIISGLRKIPGVRDVQRVQKI
jgi:GTP pyrophosphokinase